MTTPAYDDWAQWYDLGEGNRELHADYYAALAPPGARRVLELGCGTGVLLAEVRRRLAASQGPATAVHCVGLDLSPAMLQRARLREPAIDWVQGDFARVPLAGGFDYVFCAVASFQFLPSDQALRDAFAAARALCAPGAVFAFDLFQPNLPYLRQARSGTPTRRLAQDGRELQILEDSRYDDAARRLRLDWRLVEAHATGEVLARARFDIRQFFPAAVGGWLDEAGFVVEQRYGGFRREPFDAASVRQAWVCRPRQSGMGLRQGGK